MTSSPPSSIHCVRAQRPRTRSTALILGTVALLLRTTGASAGDGLPSGVWDVGQTQDGAYDLSVLHGIVGEARFVGLGEQVHRSGGLYEVKADAIRRLIEHEGFRVLAMETPWFAAEQAAAYVRTCEGTSREALGSVLDAFDDVATAELLEWMCAWNLSHRDDPVSFMGFDIQQPADDARALIQLLPALGLDDHTHELRDGLLSCSSANPPTWGATAPTPTSRAERHACMNALDAVQQALGEDLTSDERYRASLHRRGLFAWQLEATLPLSRAVPARDEGMADVLLWRVEREHPSDKVIVWAHDLHLAYDGERRQPGFADMGAIFRSRLRADWVAIAIISSTPRVCWPGLVAPPERGQGSLETWLGAQMADALLVETEALSRVPGPTAWTVRYEGRFRPSEQFAAVLWIRESRAQHTSWLKGAPESECTLERDAPTTRDSFRMRRSSEPSEAADAWVSWFRGHGWSLDAATAPARRLTKVPWGNIVISAENKDDETLVHLDWEVSPLVTTVAGLRQHTGASVRLSGRVRRIEDRTLLEFADGEMAQVLGNPWDDAWRRQLDGLVRYVCTVVDERTVRDCRSPVLP